MKTLLLMRHAKSSWKQKELQDFDRPLNKRGKKDAPRMGHLLAQKNVVPQLILSSPAIRARETVEAVIEASKFRGEVRYFDSLYMAEPSIYMDLIQALPEGAERVMLVGHNPGIEAVLQMLTEQVEALPTAAIAQITLPVQNWKSVTLETKGKLDHIWRPKELK